MIKPQKLQPHATIGVVAPASPMKVEKLEKGVSYLERLGYRVEVGKSVYQCRGYLAGDDAARARDLNEMFARKDIDAIFCVRGGYGTPRILSLVDYDLIRNNPKIFVGYSDITALQLAIFKHANLVTFSGPMVAVEFAGNIHPATEENFWQILTQPRATFEFKPMAEPMFKGLTPGHAQGYLLGGCLALLCSLLGTSFCPDFRGAVLFFEDVGEEPYRIDQYLAHLKNAGVLEHVVGIISGKFKDCEPKNDSPSLSLEETLRDYFIPLNKPTIQNFDYGHGDIKYTLPLGIKVGMDSSLDKIELLEAAVAD